MRQYGFGAFTRPRLMVISSLHTWCSADATKRTCSHHVHWEVTAVLLVSPQPQAQLTTINHNRHLHHLPTCPWPCTPLHPISMHPVTDNATNHRPVIPIAIDAITAPTSSQDFHTVPTLPPKRAGRAASHPGQTRHRHRRHHHHHHNLPAQTTTTTTTATTTRNNPHQTLPFLHLKHSSRIQCTIHQTATTTTTSTTTTTTTTSSRTLTLRPWSACVGLCDCS